MTFFQKIHNSHMSLISLILAELCPIVAQKTFCTVSRWWPSMENLLTRDNQRLNLVRKFPLGQHLSKSLQVYFNEKNVFSNNIDDVHFTLTNVYS